MQTVPDQDAPPDHRGLKRASVRGAALTFVSQAIRLGGQFGTQIMLAHWLLPAQFGLVAMAAPVLSLVQVFNDLGLSQATIQREVISRDELSVLFWINLAVSLVLALCVGLAAPLIAAFYRQPGLAPIMAALGALLVFSGAGSQQIALMNRHMRYRALAGIDIACALAVAATGLVAVTSGLGSWSLVLMQAVNSATILVLAWSLSDWRPSWPRRGTQVASLLRTGGHLTGYNILAYFEVNLSTVLIGRLNGSAAVGLYDRAFRLVIVPWCQVSLPIDRVAVSLLSRLVGSPAAYARAHAQMLLGLLLLTGPGLVWASAQAEDLVPLLLGHSWVEAAPIFRWLSLAVVPGPFAASAYWLFVSQERARAQMHYGFAGAGALLASVLAGIHWGPLGVARAYFAFTPIMVGIPVWGATRHGPVTLAGMLRSMPPIFVGLAIAGAAQTVQLPGNGPWLSARLAATLLLAYGGCGAGMALLPSGRRLLADVWELRLSLKA